MTRNNRVRAADVNHLTQTAKGRWLAMFTGTEAKFKYVKNNKIIKQDMTELKKIRRTKASADQS